MTTRNLKFKTWQISIKTRPLEENDIGVNVEIMPKQDIYFCDDTEQKKGEVYKINSSIEFPYYRQNLKDYLVVITKKTTQIPS